MTAFLKIDCCKACIRETPWEWVPPTVVAGSQLAGTGVWRSALLNELCATCLDTLEAERRRQREADNRRESLIRLLGGVKPFREFTLEHYEVTALNRAAYEKVKQFDPAKENLYLWGPPGVGRTHLALAAARTAYCQNRSVEIATPARLVRKLRMKSPEEEQHAIDGFIRAEILVLDDLGIGSDTAYSRQVLQEILDGRDYADRAGLVITSQYSPAGLARRLAGDETIPSRIAGMCQVVEIKGRDHRLVTRANPQKSGCPPPGSIH